jgi:hypothetical protein
VSAALARWEAFLSQIAARHAAICAEAEEGSQAALAACGNDVTPLAHAWMAVTDRLKELEQRIASTWHEKVEAVFEAEGLDRDLQLRELERGNDLAFELENRREASEQRSFARAARELHARALAEQVNRRCGHCGVDLPVPVTYRAVNVSCRHCGTLVTFEPGTLARMAVAAGSHAMAWEAAMPEWLAMRRAERALRLHRSPSPLALLKAQEHAQIAYWWKYFTAKAHFEPEVRDVAREVRARMPDRVA